MNFDEIAEPDEIPDALEAAKASGAAAINVLSSPLLYGNRQIIIQRAATLRLPAIYQFPEVHISASGDASRRRQARRPHTWLHPNASQNDRLLLHRGVLTVIALAQIALHA